MFSPVIMLLLGGFAIAAALSKHYIAKAIAANVLSRVRKPNNIVLATMFVATFASMWISNVASPVLCYSLVQPILRRQTYEGQPLSKVRTMAHLALHTALRKAACALLLPCLSRRTLVHRNST